MFEHLTPNEIEQLKAKARKGSFVAAQILSENGILLECPFCGGNATITDSVRFSGAPQVFVICTCCHTRGKEAPDKTPKKELRIVAALFWNTRTAIKESGELLNAKM